MLSVNDTHAMMKNIKKDEHAKTETQTLNKHLNEKL